MIKSENRAHEYLGFGDLNISTVKQKTRSPSLSTSVKQND